MIIQKSRFQTLLIYSGYCIVYIDNKLKLDPGKENTQSKYIYYWDIVKI